MTIGPYVKLFSSDTGNVTDRRTDRQTDGRTDGQICYINTARQYADARQKIDKRHIPCVISRLLSYRA